MTIDGTAAISIAGIIVGVIAMVIAGLLKLTNADINRRLTECERGIKEQQLRLDAMSERLRLDELETVRIRGEVNTLTHRVDSLEREHVPRAELEQQFESIKEQLREVMRRLDRTPGRYASSDQNMPVPGRRNTP